MAAEEIHPRRIRVMDPTLANQIAAGEVVERPASVLKELMENALDAGATRVQVLVERGGAGRIRVRDDGSGIHRDDLALALERHATSKVTSLDELEAVRTLGFRGEALPSIASVSRLRLESRNSAAAEAFAVEMEGARSGGPPAPASHPPGTTVEVRDLFFNTPARRRFLRTERTEMRHLELVFRRMALARMDVAMTLAHGARTVHHLVGASEPRARSARVAKLLGGAFTSAALPVANAVDDLRVEGWVGAPAGAGQRGDLQHLFVNRRPVSDTVVRHAVRVAFGEALERGAQPSWLLFLELDPRAVDVNVHPSKLEVRFHDARRIHDFVRSSVARALSGRAQSPVAGIREPSADSRSAFGHQRGDRTPTSPAAERPSDGSAAARGADLAGAQGVALVEGRVLVLRSRDALLVASIAELFALRARLGLAAILGGAPAAARPLLLPERFELRACDGPTFDVMRARLGALAVTVSMPVPGQAVLLGVPACLERVPAHALASALATTRPLPADASGWIDALSEAARRGEARELEQAVDLAAAVDRLLPRDASRPWRALDAERLERLVREG